MKPFTVLIVTSLILGALRKASSIDTTVGVICYTTANRCVGDDDALTIADCCNTTSVQRSYRPFGSEICSPCQFQIRCYVGEQCSADSGGVEPRTIQSMVVNGEEHCCNGNFSSWTREGSATCNMCPTQETTAGIPTTAETTTGRAGTETTSPELYSSTTVGNRTESAQTGSGCSAGCIAGVVLGAVALVTAISAIAAVVIIFITKK